DLVATGNWAKKLAANVIAQLEAIAVLFDDNVVDRQQSGFKDSTERGPYVVAKRYCTRNMKCLHRKRYSDFSHTADPERIEFGRRVFENCGFGELDIKVRNCEPIGGPLGQVRHRQACKLLEYKNKKVQQSPLLSRFESCGLFFTDWKGAWSIIMEVIREEIDLSPPNEIILLGSSDSRPSQSYER
ncbi:36589_t:CDS:2, partial [Gigaspora margarita]